MTGYDPREAITFALDLDRFLALEPNHSCFFVACGGLLRLCGSAHAEFALSVDFCHIGGDFARRVIRPRSRLVIRRRQFVDNGLLTYAGTGALRYKSGLPRAVRAALRHLRRGQVDGMSAITPIATELLREGNRRKGPGTALLQ